MFKVRCLRCGADLTNETSQKNQCGPYCFQKIQEFFNIEPQKYFRLVQKKIQIAKHSLFRVQATFQKIRNKTRTTECHIIDFQDLDYIHDMTAKGYFVNVKIEPIIENNRKIASWQAKRSYSF